MPTTELIGLRIDVRLLSQIDALAAEVGSNRSEMVRRILTDGARRLVAGEPLAGEPIVLSPAARSRVRRSEGRPARASGTVEPETPVTPRQEA